MQKRKLRQDEEFEDAVGVLDIVAEHNHAIGPGELAVVKRRAGKVLQLSEERWLPLIGLALGNVDTASWRTTLRSILPEQTAITADLIRSFRNKAKALLPAFLRGGSIRPEEPSVDKREGEEASPSSAVRPGGETGEGSRGKTLTREASIDQPRQGEAGEQAQAAAQVAQPGGPPPAQTAKRARSSTDESKLAGAEQQVESSARSQTRKHARTSQSLQWPVWIPASMP
eukprot:scaffold1437_cov268-Pinguiococcus_pyrenoidosus.AAC.9